MTANFYYSDFLTNDDEGNLIMLCEHHANTYADAVSFAARGDDDCTCELCNDQAEPQIQTREQMSDEQFKNLTRHIRDLITDACYYELNLLAVLREQTPEDLATLQRIFERAYDARQPKR